MNFIKSHLVSRIKIMYKKNEGLGDGKFLYFDTPMSISESRKIDRINVWYLFCAGENAHTGWQEIPGTALCEAYSSMKTGKFYAYKCIQGKNYKLRRKCSEK